MKSLRKLNVDGEGFELFTDPDYIDYRVLAAGAAETVTVPTDQK